MRAVLVWVLIGVAIVALAVGLNLGLPPYNAPSTHNLVLNVNGHRTYKIQVQSTMLIDFPVSKDGRVTVDIPVLPRSCSWRWFGLTIVDRSPYGRRVIQVVCDGKVMRRLSIRELEKLPLDESGAHKLKL